MRAIWYLMFRQTILFSCGLIDVTIALHKVTKMIMKLLFCTSAEVCSTAYAYSCA